MTTVTDRKMSGRRALDVLAEVWGWALDPRPVCWSRTRKRWVRTGTRDADGRPVHGHRADMHALWQKLALLALTFFAGVVAGSSFLLGAS